MGLEATKEKGKRPPYTWLGVEVVLSLRWRLARKPCGRQWASLVPRRTNYGARRVQVEEAEAGGHAGC